MRFCVPKLLCGEFHALISPANPEGQILANITNCYAVLTCPSLLNFRLVENCYVHTHVFHTAVISFKTTRHRTRMLLVKPFLL